MDAQYYIDIVNSTTATHHFDYTRLVKHIEYLDTHDDAYIAMLEEPFLINNEFNTWMPNNKSKDNKSITGISRNTAYIVPAPNTHRY